VIDALLAEQSLKHYIEQAWHVVEPKKPLIWNWHMDVICAHLEAVTNTFKLKSNLDPAQYSIDRSLPIINYLWFNVPPRHSKSLMVSVFWPTWEWGPQNLPEIKYIFSSYAQDLSTRDSLKRRRIIQSDWYQSNWGHRFCFVGDQNQKTRFENNKTGYCIATSVGGIGTGEGGDRIITDDAHNIKDVESDTKRESVLDDWDNTMSTRLNDEDTGAYVGIMQRSHQLDLSGHVIEKAKQKEIDLTHVCLPARYEKDHPFPSDSLIDFKDPRTVEGEVLDKERFPDHKLSKIEKRMTAWSKAGQLQQRPTVRGGQIFPVDKIHLVDKFYDRQLVKVIRYWDKAGTQDGGKRTAGVKIAKIRDNAQYDILIMDVVKGQWEAGPRENRIQQTAQLDGKTVRVYVEQEGGSGGKESVQNTLRKTLMGFAAYADHPTGDKFVRMDPLASCVENGRLAVLIAPWTSDFLDEMESCGPGAAFVDQCDAAAGGYNKLGEAKIAGVWGRKTR